jgi:hypothetical protein
MYTCFIMSTHWKAGESQHVHCHHDKQGNQAKPATTQAYSNYMSGTHMSQEWSSVAVYIDSITFGTKQISYWILHSE